MGVLVSVLHIGGGLWPVVFFGLVWFKKANKLGFDRLFFKLFGFGIDKEIQFRTVYVIGEKKLWQLKT